MGSLLFALTIQDVLTDCRKEFPSVQVVAYLDDITLQCDDPKAIEAATLFVQKRLQQLGLELNPQKCEWFSPLDPGSCPFPQWKQPTQFIKILGCLFGPDDALLADELLERTKQKHERFFDLLLEYAKTSPAQAIIILRKCGVPKMNYAVRVHPPEVSGRAANWFDSRMEHAWSQIAQVRLTDTARRVAHLPLKYGGCGFTRLSWVKDHAHVASVSMTVNGCPEASQKTLVEEFNVRLKEQIEQTNPRLSLLLSESIHPSTNKWFTAAKWLAPGQLPDFNTASAALRQRLCTTHRDLPHEFECPGCGHQCSADGIGMEHLTGCSRVKGHNVSASHALLKDLVTEAYQRRGAQVEEKEPVGLASIRCRCGTRVAPDDIEQHARENGCDLDYLKQAHVSRPDLMLHIRNHAPMYLDVTTVSLTQQLPKKHEAEGASYFLEARKKAKDRHYAHWKDSKVFILAATHRGSFSDEFNTVNNMVLKHSTVPGDSPKFLQNELARGMTYAAAKSLLNAEQKSGVISRPPCPFVSDPHSTTVMTPPVASPKDFRQMLRTAVADRKAIAAYAEAEAEKRSKPPARRYTSSGTTAVAKQPRVRPPPDASSTKLPDLIPSALERVITGRSMSVTLSEPDPVSPPDVFDVDCASDTFEAHNFHIEPSYTTCSATSTSSSHSKASAEDGNQKEQNNGVKCDLWNVLFTLAIRPFGFFVATATAIYASMILYVESNFAVIHMLTFASVAVAIQACLWSRHVMRLMPAVLTTALAITYALDLKSPNVLAAFAQLVRHLAVLLLPAQLAGATWSLWALATSLVVPLGLMLLVTPQTLKVIHTQQVASFPTATRSVKAGSIAAILFMIVINVGLTHHVLTTWGAKLLHAFASGNISLWDLMFVFTPSADYGSSRCWIESASIECPAQIAASSHRIFEALCYEGSSHALAFRAPPSIPCLSGRPFNISFDFLRSIIGDAPPHLPQVLAIAAANVTWHPNITDDQISRIGNKAWNMVFYIAECLWNELTTLPSDTLEILTDPASRRDPRKATKAVVAVAIAAFVAVKTAPIWIGPLGAATYAAATGIAGVAIDVGLVANVVSSVRAL
jgi:hypothetical protein